jgi:parallel beta-helix repeat protein
MSDATYCYANIRFNTISGNTASAAGGGIYSDNSEGETIYEGNTIEENQAGVGGGLSSASDLWFFHGNRVSNNQGASGAGVSITGQARSFEGNLVVDNAGIGAYFDNRFPATIAECTIVGNQSVGVHVHYARLTLQRCIVAFNGGQAVTCRGITPVALDCSNVFGNGSNSLLCTGSVTGLTTRDPLFCATAGENAYHLFANSPCAPQNSPCGQLIGAYPVVCDSAAVQPLFVTCPEDAFVALDPAGTTVTLKRFLIINRGNTPSQVFYQLSSSGPAVLFDNGNPQALVGVTPVLLSGESYSPPVAQLLAPAGQNAFRQDVSCHVFVVATGVDETCSASVIFEQSVGVAFQDFVAHVEGQDVHLAWTINSDGGAELVAVRRRKLGSVQTPTIIAEMPIEKSHFVDTGTEPAQTYMFDVMALLGGIPVAISTPVQVHVPALGLRLLSLTPNPFRTSARIVFSVPSRGQVAVEVFDVRGGRVRTLVNEPLGPGTHTVEWHRDDSGGSAPSGVYFVRLSFGKLSVKTKLVLVR